MVSVPRLPSGSGAHSPRLTCQTSLFVVWPALQATARSLRHQSYLREMSLGSLCVRA